MDAAIPADAQNAPTGIWKSRTEREIPTAPTPIIVVVNERKNNGDSNSVAKPSTESDQAHHCQHPLCVGAATPDMHTSRGGQFPTPITPPRGSIFHADSHSVIAAHVATWRADEAEPARARERGPARAHLRAQRGEPAHQREPRPRDRAHRGGGERPRAYRRALRRLDSARELRIRDAQDRGRRAKSGRRAVDYRGGA